MNEIALVFTGHPKILVATILISLGVSMILTAIHTKEDSGFAVFIVAALFAAFVIWCFLFGVAVLFL